jgi:FkbM family methyltransferase
MPIPHYQITYAQNREDLILAGIFRKIAVGFYVDLGANHPELNSVTKIFYDKGWSGINVDPHEHLILEFRRQRPRDVNIQAGVASQRGTMQLRCYPEDGEATFSADVKGIRRWMNADIAFFEKSVEVLSLAEILAQHRPTGDIHFLKVDVEGLELEVLLGNKWERFRPWVLCLERGIFQARRNAINAFLAAWNYVHVFYDGLNDYYLATERRDLTDDLFYARDVLSLGPAIPAAFLPYLFDAGAPPAVAGGKAATPTRARHVRELLALDGEAFVLAAYATLLNRVPDPGGLENYLAELGAGVAKLAILSRLRHSEEGRRHKVPLKGLRRAMLSARLRVGPLRRV